MGLAPSKGRKASRMTVVARCLSHFFNTLRDNKGPWIVLAIAIVVRAVYLFSYQQTPLSATYLADQAYYHTWALQIAGGNWLGTRTS